MKNSVFSGLEQQALPLLLCCFLTGVAWAAQPQAQFVSTVQIAVQEPTPALTLRSQSIAMEALANVFDSWPELSGKRYEIKKVGNEVVSYIVSNEDVRAQMEHAVSAMFANLSGKTHARGRYLFYRTGLTQPVGGYRVVVDDLHRIRSIMAQSVPLRDLLKDMKMQLGSLSYLMPGDCAERLVDWNFGDEGAIQPKTVDGAMSELATLLNLRLAKQNGTYIFNGDCGGSIPRRTYLPTDLLHSPVMPGNQGYRATQVYFPLMPMGE